MKLSFLWTAILGMMLCTVSAFAAENNILVAYFSQIGEQHGVGVIEEGNTEIIAKFIADETGADLFHIQRVEPYPFTYKEQTQVAKAEMGKRPALLTDVQDWEQYDTVFLGYPIWWGDLPMPVYTFIENLDWSGKRVIPFCTHAGTGRAGTFKSIAKSTGLEPLKGLAMYGTLAQKERAEARSIVQDWLKELGF